jgi:hypothetical protein
VNDLALHQPILRRFGMLNRPPNQWSIARFWELIAGLVTAGRREVEAHTGSTRIRYWIDADDQATDREGAERQEYLRAGRSYEPRNGPMEAVEEVRQVLELEGLSDATLEVSLCTCSSGSRRYPMRLRSYVPRSAAIPLRRH